MSKINLGCGKDHKKGYINIDISSQVKPDKVVDLEKAKLPFKDDSVEEIISNHVLEHINNFVPLMHELHRICKEGAIIKIRVPFYNSPEQYTDPTHVRFFSPFTFNYFDTKSNINMYSHEVKSEKSMFKVKKVKLNFGIGRMRKLNWLFNPVININHRIYCRFLAGFLPASEIYFELEVVK